MAKIKFGAIVVDGSGKLGGHVMSKNRGGNYLRTKVTPVNPQTPDQTAQRAIFAGITSGWSALSVGDRQSWNDKSSFFASTNIFGDLKEPSGKALYQQLNLNLLGSGQAALSVAPNPIALPSPAVIMASIEIGLADLTIQCSNSLLGNKVILLATPPVSPGTSYIKNKLRHISAQAGQASGGYGDLADYTAKFGSLVAGDVVFLGIKIVNVSGQASPTQTFRVIVQA